VWPVRGLYRPLITFTGRCRSNEFVNKKVFEVLTLFFISYANDD